MTLVGSVLMKRSLKRVFQCALYIKGLLDAAPILIKTVIGAVWVAVRRAKALLGR